MFSKNSASSRAIPFKKMVEMIKTNPFIPIAWQKDHKGMQGTEYIKEHGETGEINYVARATRNWLVARDYAVEQASYLNSDECSVTKQLCNRLLEPFMWHKVVLTTGLEGLRNFFSLRCPEYTSDKGEVFKSRKEFVKAKNNKEEGFHYPVSQLGWLQLNKGQAEIHMMELAEQMYDAYNESVPQLLNEGEWHIPYDEELLDLAAGKGYTYKDIIKASTGLCARTSYITVGDEKIPSIETLIGIHDKMVNAIPKHSSPMEHCSRVMTTEEYECYYKGYFPMDGSKDECSPQIGWCRNYKSYIQYRQILEENEKL
jgi:hypothetical protein